jgi:putative alpha-1,2-mannosidase
VGELQALFDAKQFDLGNEPDLAHPYLFTHVPGQAWRTQQLVRTLREEFRDAPDGLPGNDDAGALSAWFVWSALGLYPTCPASNRYDIGSPLFDRATVGNFTIEKRGSGPYVRSLAADGRPLAGFQIDHDRVRRGGRLVVEMSPER